MTEPGDSGLRRVNFARVGDEAPGRDPGAPAIEIPPHLRPRAYPAYRRRPPENEVPAPLAIVVPLVIDDELAVWLTDVSIYSTGLQFRLEGRTRVAAMPSQQAPFTSKALNLGRHARPNSTAPISLSLQFSDGTTVSSSSSNKDLPQDPQQWWLDGGGGYSSSHSGSAADYFLTPLPPAGSLTVVVSYPEFGIGETRTAIDLSTLDDAAARVVALWPTEQER